MNLSVKIMQHSHEIWLRMSNDVFGTQNSLGLNTINKFVFITYQRMIVEQEKFVLKH